MKILAKNTVILKSSFDFNEDNTKVKYQANTELYVEGNPFEKLFTPETIFDLECSVSDMSNIQKLTEEQVSKFISKKYEIK